MDLVQEYFKLKQRNKELEEEVRYLKEKYQSSDVLLVKSYSELAEIFEVSTHTISIYLSRAEFSQYRTNVLNRKKNYTKKMGALFCNKENIRNLAKLLKKNEESEKIKKLLLECC